MRIDSLLSEVHSEKKVTDIVFIVPDEPFEAFGNTFNTLDEMLAYCDENSIKYIAKSDEYRAYQIGQLVYLEIP